MAKNFQTDTPLSAVYGDYRMNNYLTKHMLRRSLYIILLFTSHCLQAQLVPFKTYTTKNGLISNQISAIIQDERGVLWVGTPFGINWFDGHTFSEPAIKTRTGQLYVTNFFKDKKEKIWILTFYNGLYGYDNHRFTNYLPDSLRLESNANNIFDILQYDDSLFLLATDHNIYWFNGNSFSLFDKNNSSLAIQFNSITAAGKRWIFLGCPRGIFIYKMENGKWEYAGTVLENHEIHQILINGTQAWISTNKGLLLFDDFNKVISGKPEKILFENKFVSGITINKKTGEQWISSDKLYHSRGNSFGSYDLTNGLPAIPGRPYFDGENIAWLPTNKGLCRLVRENYHFYELAKSNVNSMVTALMKDEKDDLWIGTYDGLVRKKGNDYDLFYDLDGKKVGYVSWLQKNKKNELLAGTASGIIYIRNDRLTLQHKIETTKVYEDDEGVFWIGTVNGKLYRLKDDILSEVKLSPFLGDFIDAIYKDNKGFLFLGYRSNGIRKFTGKDAEFKLVKEYSHKTGFQDLKIRCSYTDNKGNLLFGTRTNGIFIISGVDENKTWHITTANGLSSNWVKNIEGGHDQDIYLATNKGVNILSGSYDNPFLRKIELVNDELTEETNSIYADKDNVWIGTEQGILEYFPKNDKADTIAPLVYLTDLSINGKRDTTLPPYFSYAKKRLGSDNNIIAFEFAGINLKGDASLQYRYMLEGQDKQWTYSEERNFVSYNLPAGEYTFKVEAGDQYGRWSKQPAIFSFVISTPFWKTWWFISGILLLIASFLFLVYRYRTQQALKLERLRSRISTDLHDDIGSTLSSISILSDIAVKEKDLHESENMMQEIKHSSVSLMEKMDDIVWSINPGNDSIENLMLRIKRFASKLLEAKEIDYTIHIDDSIYHARLEMETRQHIYLIMKEAINNLVKYSGCTKARIEVKYLDHHLHILISDNGRGFNEQNIQLGNGIISMKKRAEAIKAQIKIITELNKGTTIMLQTKIK